MIDDEHVPNELNPHHLDSTTVEDAREWLIENAETGQEKCPCCRRPANLYNRGLYGTTVAAFLEAAHRFGQDQFHTRSLSLRGGDFSKFEYWGFVDRLSRDRDEANPGVGWYRITDEGMEWAHNRSRVPSHAVTVLDPNEGRQRLVRFETKKGELTAREALGEKFNYDELMGRT